MKPKASGSYRKRIDGVVATLITLSVLARQQPVKARHFQAFIIGGDGPGRGWHVHGQLDLPAELVGPQLAHGEALTTAAVLPQLEQFTQPNRVAVQP